GQLRRERLGAGDRDLGTRVRVDDGVRTPRDARVDGVADREHLGAALARGLYGGERVSGFTRLRHDDQHRSGLDHGIAVAELAAVIDFGRNARNLLEEVFADETGVPRRAAGDEHDAFR